MNIKIVFVSLFITFSLLSSIACSNMSPGEKLYNDAQKLEKQTEYIKAQDIYKKAKVQLDNEGKFKLSDQSRFAFTRMQKITMTYPYTEEAAIKIIKERHPKNSLTQINRIIKEGRLPHINIGKKTYYFSDFLNTLFYVYPDFRTHEEAGALGRVTKLFKLMSNYIYPKDKLKPGQTLTNPKKYLVNGQLTIPRKQLAPKGLLKIWIPLPLATAAQTDIEILKIEPAKYIKYPIKLDGDIALVYMEIPLEKLEKDLKISTKFRFKHYEERFSVELKNIGEYDKDSFLYKRYTASAKNIAITPSIEKTAKELAGKETNPYLIAKKFYNHIVYDLDYSYTPHAALEALGIPESVFVHEHGYGDCGAQSMYFAALCRAVGIPARASGGMQLFPFSDAGCGDHFWAQFYLPNYGWIPVDTSVGQMGKYMPNLSKKQKNDYIDYFFTKMDPFRYLIQKDVDITLIPKPEEPLAFSIVLQTPTAICSEMDENPGLLLMDNWKIKIKEIK